LQKVLEKMDIR